MEDIGFVWDLYAEEWEQMLTALAEYRAEHGHCIVPHLFSQNPKLAAWVKTQRMSCRQGMLSKNRIQRLEEIGFAWDPTVFKWEKMFEALKEFKSEHGHCNVPHRFSQNPKLGLWIGVQRRAYDTGKLSTERVKRLEGLGIIWDRHAALWEEMYEELVSYKTEHGDCNVSKASKEYKQLARWVGTQRWHFGAGRIDAGRLKRLESLGFEWDPKAAEWEKKFSTLCAFKEQYGHCNVPHRFLPAPDLGTWVGNLRRSYKSCKLSPMRIAQLEKIGFEWSVVGSGNQTPPSA